MLISAEDVLQAQRYDDDEKAFVTVLIMAAEAFLENAGAMRRKNLLTPAVIHLIVGFWLENRESEYTDFNEPDDFPLGMRSLIVQLQYIPEDPVDEITPLEEVPIEEDVDGEEINV